MAEVLSWKTLRLHGSVRVPALIRGTGRLKGQVSVPQAARPLPRLRRSAPGGAHALPSSDWSGIRRGQPECGPCRGLLARRRRAGGAARRGQVCAVTQEAATDQTREKSTLEGEGEAVQPHPAGQGQLAAFASDPLKEWLEAGPLLDEARREWALNLQQAKREIEELRKELQELLQEMAAMVNADDIAGALALADANLAAVEVQLAEEPGGMEHALMLEMLAQVYCSTGEVTKGEEVLDQAAAIVDSVAGDSALFLGAELLHQMAELYAKLERPQEAMRYWELSLTVHERLGVPTFFMGPTIQCLGFHYHKLGRFQEASGIHRHFLARLETEDEENPILKMQLLTNLAVLLESEPGGGSVQEAEDALTDAALLAVETHGPLSYEAATRWVLLGGWKVNRGLAEEAELLLERAIPIIMSHSSEVPGAREAYLQSQVQLSMAKLALGKEDEAVTLLSHEVESSPASVGPDTPKMALPFLALADVHMSSQRWGMALPLLGRALEILQADGRDGGLECSTPLQMRMWCHFYSGDLGQAEQAANGHLAWARRVLGEDQPHQILAAAYFSLGTIMVAQRRWRKAEPWFYRALGTIEALAGAESPHLIQPMEGLLEVLENLHRERSAAKYRARLHELREAQSKEDGSND